MTKPALPLLVLLPGLDGSGAFFTDLIKSLGNKTSIQVLNYPEDGPQAYDALATRLLPQLPLGQDYILLAESFGGPLAVLLASKAAVKPKGLILAATFARSPFPLFGGIISAVVSGFLQTKPLPVIEATLLREGDHKLAWDIYQTISILKPSVLSARIKTVLSCDVRKPLAALDLPILYIQGAKDRLISAAHGLLMQKTARKLRIARIDTPHFALQYDTDDTVRDVLIPFLTELK